MTRGSCWRAWSRARSTSGCAIGSSPRRAATRWRCSSCRAAARPPSWRAGSGWTARRRCRAGSSRASRSGWRRCRQQTRLLLLVAAAEPVGEPLLVWKAAAALGIPPDAAGPGDRGRPGRHRRAGALPPSARALGGLRRGRRRGPPARAPALAEATDADVDPDRRAWHRARATAGLDEDVAAELERSAGRARARGGLAAGAAFHERAAELTPDPRRRAQRALVAAQGKHQAGAPDAALRLLAMRPGRAAGRARPGTRAAAARADHVRDHARPRRSAAAARGGQAARTARSPRSRARPTSTRSRPRCPPTAWSKAATRARSPPPSSPPTGSPPTRACDLLLDGLALLTSEGYTRGRRR